MARREARTLSCVVWYGHADPWGSVPRSVSSSWSAESAQAQRMKPHSAQLMAARRQDYCRAKSDATRRRCRIAWLIALSGSLEGASEIVVPQSGKA